MLKTESVLFLLILSSVISHTQASAIQLVKLDNKSNTSIYTDSITQSNATSWDNFSSDFLMSYSHGDYTQARNTAQKSLDYAKRVYGHQHQNTADALNRLGIAAEAIGELDVAKSYYENSLALFNSSLGAENEKVAMVLNNLGNLFFLKKGYVRSEEMHLKSMLMRQQLFSSVHPTVARSAYNLGKLYEKQSKNTDAIMFYRQAAVLWKKTLGPNHPNIANAFNNLANVYSAQGNNTTAEEFHLKALSIRKKNLGPEHLEVAESLFNLGAICTKQEKYDEAESFYLDALVIMEKSLDLNDPQIAITLYSLANIYHIQAQQEYVYNQELINRIHSNSAASTKNDIIINQLRFRKKYVSEIFTKAEPLYQRAIDIAEVKFGAEHPSVKVMKDELAMLYTNIKKSIDE